MDIVDLQKLEDKMREAVLEPCGMDRFRMKFLMSRETLTDMTVTFKEREYRREWESRQEQAKWNRELMRLTRSNTLIGQIIETVEHQAAKKLHDEKPKSDPFHLERISSSLISTFMGRPIEIDDAVPYGEFKLVS